MTSQLPAAGTSTRNFRLYLVGQAVAMGGTFMRTLALTWLVLERTNDNATAVGFAIALQYLPILLLGSWIGLVADRVDKRKMLMIGQLIGAGAAAGLAVVTVSSEGIGPVFALVCVGGVAQAVDLPTRQAFLPEVVSAEELTHAVGLLSATSQAARIVGPLCGGVLVATVGTATAFVANAVSFLALIGALGLMDPSQLHSALPTGREPGQIRAGFRYMWRTPVLRGCLAVMAVVGMFALNNQILFPVLARESFGGGAASYSWMLAAMGFGALIGSLVITRRGTVTAGFFVASGISFGGLMGIAAYSPTLVVFMSLLVACGVCQTLMLSSGQVLLQLAAEGHMRGRVMSVWTMGLVGTTPVGGPVMGWLASTFHARFALAAGGLAAVVVFLAVARTLRRHDVGNEPPRPRPQRLRPVRLPSVGVTSRASSDPNSRCVAQTEE